MRIVPTPSCQLTGSALESRPNRRQDQNIHRSVRPMCSRRSALKALGCGIRIGFLGRVFSGRSDIENRIPDCFEARDVERRTGKRTERAGSCGRKHYV